MLYRSLLRPLLFRMDPERAHHVGLAALRAASLAPWMLRPFFSQPPASLRRERKLQGGPSGPAGALTSFADGLESLPRALAENAPFEVRCASPVRSLEHDGERWRLDVDEAGFDAVALAGEAWHMAPLLRGPVPEVARELEALDAPGLSVVALGYGAEALARAPRGFGALIQREEGFRILGVLWDTHLFPGRSP